MVFEAVDCMSLVVCYGFIRCSLFVPYRCYVVFLDWLWGKI